jgi:hypothetical protein
MAFSTPETLISGDTLTLARYDKIKDSIIAEGHSVFELGGSEYIAMPTGGGYNYVPDWKPFIVPNVIYTGFVYKVHVEVWTENAATTITPKLRNVTDAADTVVGSAGTATARGTYQTLSATIAAGKEYRLMASKSDDVYNCWCVGRIYRIHA